MSIRDTFKYFDIHTGLYGVYAYRLLKNVRHRMSDISINPDNKHFMESSAHRYRNTAQWFDVYLSDSNEVMIRTAKPDLNDELFTMSYSQSKFKLWQSIDKVKPIIANSIVRIMIQIEKIKRAEWSSTNNSRCSKLSFYHLDSLISYVSDYNDVSNRIVQTDYYVNALNPNHKFKMSEVFYVWAKLKDKAENYTFDSKIVEKFSTPCYSDPIKKMAQNALFNEIERVLTQYDRYYDYMFDDIRVESRTFCRGHTKRALKPKYKLSARYLCKRKFREIKKLVEQFKVS